ncbi:beta-glucosidase 12 [Amborella trichopoda]|uniref:beta-glucosidase 12 n=1 Tax=Amborella trichopoda TaxID=13333 RepID=UPI0005D42AAC|nr:beta-glucosidase 12 [Amborella trichopoda]|eukprot:XP_011625439.1 beta-glucosidase 12 [Amborella trichopoda]
MALSPSLLVLIVALVFPFAEALNRSSFPPGFIFGVASSAYQYEGAAKEGGRGLSNWDVFTHTQPGKIFDGSNGDVAIDQYHLYKDDVKLMKYLGLDAYRLSIAWPRILPKGTLEGGVNRAGIDHYNSLINELLANGIQPFVTLFHWDLPQALEDAYGGFLSPNIVKDYTDYVDVCFREFGDRVKHWITLNEPYSYAFGGYVAGIFAPGRCSKPDGNCTAGNSGTEGYVVAHHLLLSHASAVKLYREKYKAYQKGVIGVTLVTHWMIPYSSSRSNDDAAQRALDFMFGWFWDPIALGDYPFSMRALVGGRLPKFTKEQSLLLKGSYDFLGLNYYTTNYVLHATSKSNVVSYSTDSQTNQTAVRNGKLIGPEAASDFLHVYPKGLEDLLLYIKKRYNSPVIYITENGIDEFNNASVPLKESLNDPMRVDFYKGHTYYLHRAIQKGVNVKGYFPWTFLDDFEWNSGFTVRFGFVFVDYKTLKRYPKRSAYWYKNFLKG